MNTALLISLVSSGTAIIVALVTAYFSNKYQKRNSFAVEELKKNFEIEKKQFELEQKRKDEHEQSILLALKTSQKIKDNFTLLANYLRFESELAEEWLNKTRNEIHNYADVFSEIFPKLDDNDKSLLHDMKKDLYHIDLVIARILHEKKQNKEVDRDKLSNSLFETRQRLTDLQQSLLVKRLLEKNES